MKKRMLELIAIVFMVGACISSFASIKNPYEAKEAEFQQEIGDVLFAEASYYLTGSESDLEETVLDFSEVNIEVVGTYPVSGSTESKQVDFLIRVVDTTKPEILLQEVTEDFELSATEETLVLPLSFFVSAVTDESGDCHIHVTGADTEVEGDRIEDLSLEFSHSGEQTLVVSAVDGNGMEATATMSLTITRDYASYVEGIKDLTSEAGEEIDYLKDVSYDREFLIMTVDDSKVEHETPGTYEVTYLLTGDEGESKVTVSLVIEETNVEVSISSKDSGESNSGGSSTERESSSSASSNESSNSNSSSSSSSSSSNSNSSSSSASSHTCSYDTPVTEWVSEEGHYETKVIEDAWTEEVEITEVVCISVCNTCGADITGNTDEHVKAHLLAKEGGSYRAEYVEQVVGTETIAHDAVTEEVWVVDKEATTKTIGYACSCGKIQYQ